MFKFPRKQKGDSVWAFLALIAFICMAFIFVAFLKMLYHIITDTPWE